MYRTLSAIGLVMSLTLLTVAPTAAGNDVNGGRGPAASAKNHRHCDWIGPGGRAVYRCGLSYEEVVKPARQTIFLRSDPPPPARSCDWIGPGGRAVYRCQVVN